MKIEIKLIAGQDFEIDDPYPNLPVSDQVKIGQFYSAMREHGGLWAAEFFIPMSAIVWMKPKK